VDCSKCCLVISMKRWRFESSRFSRPRFNVMHTQQCCVFNADEGCATTGIHWQRTAACSDRPQCVQRMRRCYLSRVYGKPMMRSPHACMRGCRCAWSLKHWLYLLHWMHQSTYIHTREREHADTYKDTQTCTRMSTDAKALLTLSSLSQSSSISPRPDPP